MTGYDGMVAICCALSSLKYTPKGICGHQGDRQAPCIASVSAFSPRMLATGMQTPFPICPGLHLCSGQFEVCVTDEVIMRAQPV